jgi:Family of unknown function (DUF6318)
MKALAATNTLMAMLFLVACSGPSEIVEPETTHTSRASQSPTTSTVPPTKPSEAGKRSSSGAATFVLYWVETAHYVSLTGEVGALREISLGSCRSCSKLEDHFASVYAQGGSYTGGERSLDDVSVQTSKSTNDVLVATKTFIGESRFRPERSARARTIPSELSPVVYRVSWTETGWRMKEFAVDD